MLSFLFFDLEVVVLIEINITSPSYLAPTELHKKVYFKDLDFSFYCSVAQRSLQS